MREEEKKMKKWIIEQIKYTGVLVSIIGALMALEWAVFSVLGID